MKDNDKGKNNITQFSDLVKSGKQSRGSDKIKFEPSDINISSVKEMFKKIGMDVEDKEIQNVLENFDFEKLMESSHFSDTKINMNEFAENIQELEAKYKKEKEMYRNFFQWISYRKPYDLSTLFQIELIRNLATSCNISWSERDSKNQLIVAIVPAIKEYIEKTFRCLDSRFMNLFGKVLYSNGAFEVTENLSDEEETRIDFFCNKCLLSRVNDNGHHLLVIPKEIFDVVQEVDFHSISKNNALNEKIITTAIAFANSYGAYPIELLDEKILYLEPLLLDALNIIDVKTYIRSILDFSFARSILIPGIYPNVIVSDDYINHGIVEFTKNLIDIQNETIDSFKELSVDDIIKRGNPNYFEDSLYLTQLLEFIKDHNKLTDEEEKQIKNQIYLFSMLEFEPSLILQILEMKLKLPQRDEYGKFIDIFRNYYRVGEKWILKGNTSYEVNHSKANYDPQKIVSIDFNKK